MSHRKQFIRSLFGLRLNGYGCDLFTTESGGAVIVCDRNTHTLNNVRMVFDSVESAENYIDSIPGNNAGRLDTLLNRLGVFSNDEEEQPIRS